MWHAHTMSRITGLISAIAVDRSPEWNVKQSVGHVLNDAIWSIAHSNRNRELILIFIVSTIQVQPAWSRDWALMSTIWYCFQCDDAIDSCLLTVRIILDSSWTTQWPITWPNMHRSMYMAYPNFPMCLHSVWRFCFRLRWHSVPKSHRCWTMFSQWQTWLWCCTS